MPADAGSSKDPPPLKRVLTDDQLTSKFLADALAAGEKSSFQLADKTQFEEILKKLAAVADVSSTLVDTVKGATFSMALDDSESRPCD